MRLNAPYGAWRFLTQGRSFNDGDLSVVLMHLMVLGAFWLEAGPQRPVERDSPVLMYLLALVAL